ncbi:MAG: efflux RND transporter periplasmic adaptor subunit, partial [Bryobacteraceae bacterium]
MSVSFIEGVPVQAGQLLASIDPRPYEAPLAQAEGQLARDQAALTNARVDLDRYKKLLAQNVIPEPQIATERATVAELEASLRADRANVDNAKLQLTYSEIRAPIAGVAGLRLIDPGNIVHAADTTGILVITQLQPIPVLFTLPESGLPPVRASLGQGVSLPAEARNRTDTVKIATGRLTAMDNQIDPATGGCLTVLGIPGRNRSLARQRRVTVAAQLGPRRGRMEQRETAPG